MITYITAFIFYTLAMIGILIVGYVVYKKTILTTKKDTKGMIKILDSLPIGPKKTLLVVKVKNEKFCCNFAKKTKEQSDITVHCITIERTKGSITILINCAIYSDKPYVRQHKQRHLRFLQKNRTEKFAQTDKNETKLTRKTHCTFTAFNAKYSNLNTRHRKLDKIR